MIVLLTATPGRSAGAGRVQALQTRQRRAKRLPPTTSRRQRESQRHAVESGGGRLPRRQHLGAQHLLLLPTRRARWEPHRGGERLGGPDVQGCRTGASEPRRQSCGSRQAVRRVARHGGRRRARFDAAAAASAGTSGGARWWALQACGGAGGSPRAAQQPPQAEQGRRVRHTTRWLTRSDDSLPPFFGCTAGACASLSPIH